MSLSSVDVPPSKSHGPRITLIWSEPAEPNGVIRSYTLFYSHNGGAPRKISGIDKDAFSHTVNVLGGVTYQFSVRAVTIKSGPYEAINVTTKAYGKLNIDIFEANITWLRLEIPSNLSESSVVTQRVNFFFLQGRLKNPFSLCHVI